MKRKTYENLIMVLLLFINFGVGYYLGYNNKSEPKKEQSYTYIINAVFLDNSIDTLNIISLYEPYIYTYNNKNNSLRFVNSENKIRIAAINVKSISIIDKK